MDFEEIIRLENDFRKIVKKYNLSRPEKAEKISKILTSSKIKKITPKEFQVLFNFENEKDAESFLKFIEEGIKFIEKKI